ncbi:xanthine dehydrogenase molybdopterin binding subunit [Acidocella facilis]|uniref:xanthine dehydrogenase molybdopterin binding subunit n=1 Tax=Acidocella facilis TaxID=525 RepID=UPI00047EAD97|nr:xanthine dehydrogenase molybdopterin binding subunit [Acidocella facilis]
MADREIQTLGAVSRPLPHDSAAAQISGTALYADDVPEAANILHGAFGLSTMAHARLTGLDLSAVQSAPGVVAVFSAINIPGKNDVSPFAGDDRLFAEDEVVYHGQALFLVVASSHQAARRAAKLGKAAYEPLPPLLSIAEALAADSLIEPAQSMGRGDVAAALAASPHRLSGRLAMGGQDHFYLEGQIAVATPQEQGGMHVLSSTQHPSEVQHIIARVLGLADAQVTVEVRRMGGGFGGKETQASLFAAGAALAAAAAGRQVKIRADRDDDMVLTGKRHEFETGYEVGFDEEGRIEAVSMELASRCGCSADLSQAINDRAMFHADNCYFYPAVKILSHRAKTHTVSATAFRGFGGPQGMIVAERMLDHIAHALGKDPLSVRLANLYGPGRDLTPYAMQVADNVAPQIIADLVASSDYTARRAAVADWNARHRIIKKGIALTPVKFGISFTTTHLNQGGALVNIYTDGSILLNHGGTEMGQGLMIKVAQVVADVFAVPVAQVRISSTRTDKVPNTSATAASSGSDLNGMAAFNAAAAIRARLVEFAAGHFGVEEEAVRFTPDGVVAGAQIVSFARLCQLAYLARVSLSATGFYATPAIHYDRASHTGRPFYYFAYGAAVAEVALDTLTGEHKVLAVDILHDVGKSLNPAIDLGQIEGGFIQGMGWLTTEELVFDADGRLLTHAPSTYKIPTASDRPARMKIELWAPGENAEPTIHRSKAVGEPPFMLANAVFCALTQAVAASVPSGGFPALDAPATPERILAAIAALRAGHG